MSKPTWTRERAKSGPADTLDSRYEIQRGYLGRWSVVDRTTWRPVSEGWRTAKLARERSRTHRWLSTVVRPPLNPVTLDPGRANGLVTVKENTQ